MKPSEKVAVLTALQKMVKAELDVARREADDDLLAAFDEDGVTERALKATFLDSGMAVPGLTFTGQTVKNTQVRGCKPEDVAPIIRQLGGIDALLLPEQTEPFSLEEA